MQEYLRKHADGNARAEDVYDLVGTDLLRSQIEAPGLPLLDVELQCRGDVRLTFKATRMGGGNGVAGPDWVMPVCVRLSGAGRFCTTIRAGSTIGFSPATCPTWVHPNAGELGYYRWRMPLKQLEALLAAPLDDRERAGLAAQLAGLVSAGELAPSDLLAYLPALVRNTSRHGVDIVIETLAELRLAAGPRTSAMLAGTIRTAFAPRARRLGLTPRAGESDEDALAREETLRAAGLLGEDRALQAAARRVATRWLDGKATIDDELLAVTLELAAAGGDSRLHARLAADARRPRAAQRDAIERRWAVLGALPLFRNRKLRDASLALALTDLRGVEASRLLGAALDDPASRAPAFAFIRTHAAELHGRLGYNAATVMARACSAAELDAITPLLAAFTAESADREAAAADLRADIESCTARRDRLRAYLGSTVR
jgi:alanyl aminopeptidase